MPRRRRSNAQSQTGMIPAYLKKTKSGAFKVLVAAKHMMKLNPQSYNPMRQWDVWIPPTMDFGSLLLGPVCKTAAEARRYALDAFNSHRKREGLPPVKSLPRGTTVKEYQR